MDNLEWLTRNTLRSYPIREDGKAVSLNTQWTLPDFLVADCLATVSSAPLGLYLSGVHVTRSILTLFLADVATGRTLGSATALLGVNSSMESLPIVPMGSDLSGSIILGTALDPDRFAQLPPGLHLFPPSARLEDHCLIETGLFPVRSLRARNGAPLNGLVQLEKGSGLKIDVSTGVDSGDPVRLLTLSLVNPQEFISPCETRATPCQCSGIPVMSINGVLPDSDGIITIVIDDPSGEIDLSGLSALNLLITRTGLSLCSKPLMPDPYGRLPDPSGSYTKDKPPIAAYQNPSDVNFPTPVI